MTDRHFLPARRGCETFAFALDGAVSTSRYVATISRFEDGRVAELFVNTDGKSGSGSDVNASDGAVAISLALQHGCPVEVLRAAFKRNADGTAQGVLGRALDECGSRLGAASLQAEQPDSK